MYNFTVPMALMDFVPVLFFGVTAVLLLCDLYNKMGRGVYALFAAKMKKGKVMILFILSFVCAMAMGYMSSQDSTQAWVNWAEQSINTVSQLCLMLGIIALHRANLKNWAW